MGFLDTVRRLLQGDREKASPGDPARGSTPPHGDPLREEREQPPPEPPPPSND